MRSILLLPLLVLTCLSGCTSCDDKTTGGPLHMQPSPDYDGPAARAAIDGDEVVVAIDVMTGGHELDLVRTEQRDDHVAVMLRLTEPGEDEGVTDATETKRHRVMLGSEAIPVYVYIKRVIRGVHYVQQPEFQLARVLAR